MLDKKCTGCGRIHGRKGTEKNHGITGSICLTCHIKMLIIDIVRYDSMIVAFPADISKPNWVKKVSRMRRELALSKLKQEQERRAT